MIMILCKHTFSHVITQHFANAQPGWDQAFHWALGMVWTRAFAFQLLGRSNGARGIFLGSEKGWDKMGYPLAT